MTWVETSGRLRLDGAGRVYLAVPAGDDELDYALLAEIEHGGEVLRASEDLSPWDLAWADDLEVLRAAWLALDSRADLGAEWNAGYDASRGPC